MRDRSRRPASKAPPAHEPTLDEMGQHAIAEDDRKDSRPITSRQRHEAERRPQRGIGKECAGAGHEDRRQDQRIARAALENGIFAVRMIWMISVCVSSDSTNNTVWNRGG